MACYIDHGATGEKHADCAKKCITGGLPQGSTGPASFFRLYPGISLVRTGGSSTLKASYTLELAGTRGDADYNSLSHGASLTFSYPASSRWKLNLTESFLATSDAASFNGLRGTTPPLGPRRTRGAGAPHK